MLKSFSLILILSSLVFSQNKLPLAPDFSLKTLRGQHFQLKEDLGPITVINFWATWCIPCLGEMKELKKLYSSYNNKGVEFVAISVDAPKTSSKVPSFVRARQLPFTILLDPEKKAYKKLQVSEIPTLIVINQKGEIVYRKSGFSTGDLSPVEDLITTSITSKDL